MLSFFFFLLMMLYKSAMIGAQRNPTVSSDSSGTSENILPNPNPTLVSTDSYSQNSALYLTATKLNGHNYLKWAQSLKIGNQWQRKIWAFDWQNIETCYW
ncbi:hypothetical protein CIPAW_10G005000 [Carya illinoinensis]|uniref:Retrotransposon Copia-like N-terminal domain-containing protein n=1 Tax=Carya illinoinensis TaxID=32201 RepID=A0A8T1P0P6_CARIL|nr:hypothetical protein CIPAW_10G005000 [Carya illinoinensis]